MSKERLEEFKDYIEFLDNTAVLQGNVRFVGALHSLYVDGWFDWIYLYAKEQTERVQELEIKHYRQELIDEHIARLEQHIERLEEQNKRYRELLTSRAMKQLIRLEDKGCFLPDEGREGFLNLKYAIEELEGEE